MNTNLPFRLKSKATSNVNYCKGDIPGKIYIEKLYGGKMNLLLQVLVKIRFSAPVILYLTFGYSSYHSTMINV